MQSRLGLPLLTMIQQLDAPESVGLQALVTHAMPTSAASESFRTLRTALTLTHPDARQIVVTSAEPGDGKTTTLANLAVCYAQAEQADAVDRRRLAASRADGLDEHAGAARPERGPPLGSRHRADGAAAHPPLRASKGWTSCLPAPGPPIRPNCSAVRGSRNCWPGRRRSTT